MVIRVEEDKTLPALSSGVPGLPLFLLVLPLIVLIVVFILIAAAWGPSGLTSARNITKRSEPRTTRTTPTVLLGR